MFGLLKKKECGYVNDDTFICYQCGRKLSMKDLCYEWVCYDCDTDNATFEEEVF